MILNAKLRNFTINALIKLLTVVALLLVWSANGHTKHILVYGDSLSAAYGMDETKGWVHLMSNALAEDYTVSNASISGETSTGGLARLALTLKELAPDLVLLELGANDGLQGHSTKRLKDNLSQMIEAIKASGAEVVLGGISLPPSYGPRYIDQFRAVYTELADQYQVPLIDLYQQSFVETPGYIQEDGLHPTEITQPIIRDMVLTFLREKKLISDAQ